MSREELVNLILDLSPDEVDDDLWHKIACENYKELVKRLGGITEYYASKFGIKENN